MKSTDGRTVKNRSKLLPRVPQHQEGGWKVTWQNSSCVMGQSNTATENHCATAWYLSAADGQDHDCTAVSVLCNKLLYAKEERRWSIKNNKVDRFFSNKWWNKLNQSDSELKKKKKEN